jgi:hypothetical protein
MGERPDERNNNYVSTYVPKMNWFEVRYKGGRADIMTIVNVDVPELPHHIEKAIDENMHITMEDMTDYQPQDVYHGVYSEEQAISGGSSLYTSIDNPGTEIEVSEVFRSKEQADEHAMKGVEYRGRIGLFVRKLKKSFFESSGWITSPDDVDSVNKQNL